MAQIKITYMMISIVTIFLICHSVEAIFIVIGDSVGNETKIVKGYVYAILVNFSAGINTLIYCIFNRKFKKKFLKLVTLECFKNSPVHSETSGFQMNPLRSRTQDRPLKIQIEDPPKINQGK